GLPNTFFFSSRRRHTRFSRDWSSDVCSSDLFRKIVTRLPFLQSGVSTSWNNSIFFVHIHYIVKRPAFTQSYRSVHFHIHFAFLDISVASCKNLSQFNWFFTHTNHF